MVSEERRRIVTQEQSERLHAARKTGGMCAACGRTLGVGETVYQEQFLIGAKRLHGRDVLVYASIAAGPVGSECASAEFLEQTVETEPERCAWCGRGVYYRQQRSARRQAICSRQCASRAGAAKQRAKERQ